MQKVYVRYAGRLAGEKGKQLSLMKLSLFISKNFDVPLTLSDHPLEQQLAAHGCYKTRKDKINMTELISHF